MTDAPVVNQPNPVSNLAAQTGVNITTGAINTGIAIGENLLFADYPPLAMPGLKQLIQFIISFFAEYVIKGVAEVVTFTVIDFQISKEESNFNDALAALKAAQASGDSNALSKAQADFLAASAAMVNYDGSTTT